MHVRHGRPDAPRVARTVVDARGIHHCRGGHIFTAEHEELVHVRRIHARGSGVVQIGHRRKRRPSVGDRIEATELIDVIADREGVTAALIGESGIAVNEPAIVINPHWRGRLPRPRARGRCRRSGPVQFGARRDAAAAKSLC